MREIKFRSWDEAYKVMHFDREFAIALDGELRFLNVSPVDFTLRDQNIMQYTGLKDKTGKEIYEGDIICVEDQETEHILDDGSGPTYPANHIVPVEFRNGCFGVEIKDKGDLIDNGFHTLGAIVTDYIDKDAIEIIGNIWETPDLLNARS